uniref:Homeobox domain-containing protein n=1 Tax=Oryza glumipatula TaxID=40148 RepID=A0A0E0B6M2_9ORYZ
MVTGDETGAVAYLPIASSPPDQFPKSSSSSSGEAENPRSSTTPMAPRILYRDAGLDDDSEDDLPAGFLGAAAAVGWTIRLSPAASYLNSTLSSLNGKHGAPSAATAAGGGSDNEDSGGGSRKKLRLFKDQAAVLEDTFKEHNTVNPKQKAVLARQLNLKSQQVPGGGVVPEQEGENEAEADEGGLRAAQALLRAAPAAAATAARAPCPRPAEGERRERERKREGTKRGGRRERERMTCGAHILLGPTIFIVGQHRHVSETALQNYQESQVALIRVTFKGVKVDLFHQRGQVAEGGPALGRTVDFGPFCMAQDAVSDSN